jgi:hypothetical protein
LSFSQAWWLVPVIATSRRLRQKNLEFKASPDYIETLSKKKKDNCLSADSPNKQNIPEPQKKLKKSHNQVSLTLIISLTTALGFCLLRNLHPY